MKKITPGWRKIDVREADSGRYYVVYIRVCRSFPQHLIKRRKLSLEKKRYHSNLDFH
ncbi:MAG: hypothetical protein GX825_06865 [Syntrophomonadaceae bacterium]|nr:hypothetical protein [Syntrophomonadaceae bacterium]